MIDTQAAREARDKYPHDEGHVCKRVRPSQRPLRRTRAHANARPRRDAHAPVGASTRTRRFIHSQSVHIHEDMYLSIFKYIFTNVGISIKPDTLPHARTHAHKDMRTTVYTLPCTGTRSRGNRTRSRARFVRNLKTRARVCVHAHEPHTHTLAHSHTRTHASHPCSARTRRWCISRWIPTCHIYASISGSRGWRFVWEARLYACPVGCTRRCMPTYTYPFIRRDAHVRPRRIEHRPSASAAVRAAGRKRRIHCSMR